MKTVTFTLEEFLTLMDLVQERHEKIMCEIYDIHDMGESIPEHLEQDCARYRDLWNKLILLKCKKQKKKLFKKKEKDLPF